MGRPVAPLRRRPLVAVLLATAVVAAVVAVLSADGGDSGERAPEQAARDGYRIAYDVVDLVTGRTTEEVVEVLPGEASRRLLPGGAGTATTRSAVYDRVDGRWRQLAVVAPGETGSELQLTATLRWGEDVGRARRDGVGTVADVTCTWWLTRDPLDASSVAAATATDRTRSCVDDAGRLLADAWRVGGTEVRARTATAITHLGRFDPLDGQSPAALDPRLRTSAVQSADAVGQPPPGCVWVSAARVLVAAPGGTGVARTMARQVADCAGVPVVLDRLSGPEEPRPSGDEQLQVGARPALARGTAGGVVVEVADGTDLLRLRTAAPLPDVLGWLAGQ